MQMGPAMDFHPPAALIGSLPRGVWFAMSALIAALKTCPVFATATTLTRLARRGGAIKNAIAFDRPQTTWRLPRPCPPKGDARGPPAPHEPPDDARAPPTNPPRPHPAAP